MVNPCNKANAHEMHAGFLGMSWLTEFDDDGDEIEDPWKALDAFIERDGDYHVWIDMAKRLRDAALALESIRRANVSIHDSVIPTSPAKYGGFPS